VAFLIIGRTLLADSGFTLDSIRHMNMVDGMTGEDDGEMESLNSSILKVARHRTSPPWTTFKLSALRPLAKQLGRRPDVYVCTDKVVGMKPKEVTQVFKLSASNQFERAHLCYQSVATARKYDLYVKVRPDFHFLGDFPDVRGIDRDYVYTRFRTASGIAGLTSAHFSGDNMCSKSCGGSPADACGYMNDDMLMVVPSKLAGRVFMSDAEGQARLEAYGFGDPPGWVMLACCGPERQLTRKLISAGILTRPLAVVGYPVYTHWPHDQWALPCARMVVQKTCGIELPIESVHNRVRSSPVFNVPVRMNAT